MVLIHFLVSKLAQIFASKTALSLVITAIEAKAHSYNAKTMASPDPTDDAYGYAAIEAVESLKKLI